MSEEYPDGTPGWFTRDDERVPSFGWLKNTAFLYERHSNPELKYYGGRYTLFEPLLEAILPYGEEYES